MWRRRTSRQAGPQRDLLGRGAASSGGTRPLAQWLGGPGPQGAGRRLLGALLVVVVVAASLAAIVRWRQRHAEPWARYRPVPLDPAKTYQVVLWDTELPVAWIPDPFRLPDGPSPDPRDRPPPAAPSPNAADGQGGRARRPSQPPPVPPLEGPGPFTHGEYLQQALQAFAREFPNVHVKVLTLPATEAASRLRRALADGKPPDVFGGWGSALVVRHPLQVPLNPYLGRAERRWYLPTALALYRVGRWDWVWPRWVAPQTWWVDAGLVREAGLDPERLLQMGWTWDDVARLARAAQQAQRPNQDGSASDARPSPRDGPPLLLWAARPDLVLHQLLRAQGVPGPMTAAGAVLWAGPEGQQVLQWLDQLRAAGLGQPLAGQRAEEFLAAGGRAPMVGGFTPALAWWLLERQLGLAPGAQEALGSSGPRGPGAAATAAAAPGARPMGSDGATGANIPRAWPASPPPDQDRAQGIVPADFNGWLLLPPPAPPGQPRPSLLEVGGLTVFRQTRYRGDDHTQAAVELARFLSRWRTDVLTRRMLALPADVTSWTAWRQGSPLPEVYRRQLEHLSQGVWNRDRRGRWQRLAVSYPLAPGVWWDEGATARRLWSPLADFWAGRMRPAQVLEAWGGPLTPTDSQP